MLFASHQNETKTKTKPKKIEISNKTDLLTASIAADWLATAHICTFCNWNRKLKFSKLNEED